MKPPFYQMPVLQAAPIGAGLRRSVDRINLIRSNLSVDLTTQGQRRTPSLGQTSRVWATYPGSRPWKPVEPVQRLS